MATFLGSRPSSSISKASNRVCPSLYLYLTRERLSAFKQMRILIIGKYYKENIYL